MVEKLWNSSSKAKCSPWSPPLSRGEPKPESVKEKGRQVTQGGLSWREQRRELVVHVAFEFARSLSS